MISHQYSTSWHLVVHWELKSSSYQVSEEKNELQLSELFCFIFCSCLGPSPYLFSSSPLALFLGHGTVCPFIPCHGSRPNQAKLWHNKIWLTQYDCSTEAKNYACLMTVYSQLKKDVELFEWVQRRSTRTIKVPLLWRDTEESSPVEKSQGRPHCNLPALSGSL